MKREQYLHWRKALEAHVQEHSNANPDAELPPYVVIETPPKEGMWEKVFDYVGEPSLLKVWILLAVLFVASPVYTVPKRGGTYQRRITVDFRCPQLVTQVTGIHRRLTPRLDSSAVFESEHSWHKGCSLVSSSRPPSASGTV